MDIKVSIHVAKNDIQPYYVLRAVDAILRSHPPQYIEVESVKPLTDSVASLDGVLGVQSALPIRHG